MPHFRASIQGADMEEIDQRLREARVGVVTSSEVTESPASGVPTDEPEVKTVEVSVDAPDEGAAEERLREALPEGCPIEILG
jgi:hypothetical protein